MFLIRQGQWPVPLKTPNFILRLHSYRLFCTYPNPGPEIRVFGQIVYENRCIRKLLDTAFQCTYPHIHLTKTLILTRVKTSFSFHFSTRIRSLPVADTWPLVSVKNGNSERHKKCSNTSKGDAKKGLFVWDSLGSKESYTTNPFLADAPVDVVELFVSFWVSTCHTYQWPPYKLLPFQTSYCSGNTKVLPWEIWFPCRTVLRWSSELVLCNVLHAEITSCCSN